MRVLFLTKYYPPAEGGIERYGHLLCTQLPRHGVDVEVVAFHDGPGATGTQVVDGVTVHRLRRHLHLARSPLSLDLAATLRRTLPGCDLVHLNAPNPWMELAFLALRRRPPAVVSYHSDVLLRQPLRGLYLPVLRRLVDSAAAVIASSPEYRDSSDLLAPRADRCRVIPYPVAPAMLQPADPEAVAAARARHGRFVLFCGRLVHYKGVEHLIAAVARLAGLRLVVAGRGPEERRYRAAAAALGVGDRVDFVGRVSDDDLRALCHASQCLVLPSVSRAESFGIVLAEAMACGRPVISTDVGSGTSAINRDGVTGLVVPPRDPAALAQAIARLVGDDDLRRRLGSQARAHAEMSFAPEAVAAETVRLYGEVLATAVGGRRARVGAL